MTTSHSRYTRERTRESGHLATTAIRVLQIILSLRALAATNITKPLWTASIMRKADIHTRALHVSIAIRLALQATDDDMKRVTIILFSFFSVSYTHLTLPTIYSV